MNTRTRLTPDVRKDQLIDAALKAAGERGYTRVTRDQIAAVAGVSPALISRHFGTMPSLRRDIVRAAIRLEHLVVLGQALAARDPHARGAGEELKARAVHAMTIAE